MGMFLLHECMPVLPCLWFIKAKQDLKQVYFIYSWHQVCCKYLYLYLQVKYLYSYLYLPHGTWNIFVSYYLALPYVVTTLLSILIAAAMEFGVVATPILHYVFNISCIILDPQLHRAYFVCYRCLFMYLLLLCHVKGHWCRIHFLSYGGMTKWQHKS